MATDQAQFRYARIITELEELSRKRELSDQESRELEQAIRRSNPTRVYFLWLPKHELSIAKQLRRSPRPTVLQLAQQFGISEGAMWRKLHKMRKLGKIGYFSEPGGTGRYDRTRFKSAWR